MAKKKKTARRRNRSSKSESLAAEAYSLDPDEIEFEDEASQDAAIFQDHLIWLYGRPKIGKTRLISLLDGIYLLPTEPGYSNQTVRKTPIPNWATFRKFVTYMEKHPKKMKKVKIWGIDTVDNLTKFCMQYVCGREGIAHPTDQEWGKGWEAYRDEFTHWILRLAVLDPGIVFVSHEVDKEVISRSTKITKAMPALPKTTYAVINNMVDLTLRMAFTGMNVKPRKKDKLESVVFQESRCLYTKPTETMDAGDRTGLLPDVIPFKKEATAVKKLISYF